MSSQKGKTPKAAKAAPKAKVAKKTAPKKATGKRALASKTTTMIPIARDSKIQSAMKITAASDMSSVRIRGREPLLTVVQNTGYKVLIDEYINALNPVLFPKLSQEAALYDKFIFRSLRLHYTPRCPTSSTGQVGLLLLPDSHLAEEPATMIEVERYEHAITCASWTESSCGVTSNHASQPWYYTAPSSEFKSASLGTVRTQSQGVVQVSVSDGSAGSLAGIVEIEYECELVDRRPPYVSGFGLAGVNLDTVNVATNPGRIIGTGSTVFQVPDLSPIVNNAYGFLGSFLTGDPLTLVPVSGSTAAYIAALGVSGLLSKSRFIKLHQGITQVFSRATFGARVVPPLGGEVKSEDHFARPSLVRQVAEPHVVPKLVRQVAEPFERVRDPIPSYPYVKCTPSGVFGSFDGNTWSLIPPVSDMITKPLLADNEMEVQMVVFDPVANTATQIYAEQLTTTSFATFANSQAITVTTAYPQWVAFGQATNLPTGNYRDDCFFNFGGVNNDST